MMDQYADRHNRFFSLFRLRDGDASLAKIRGILSEDDFREAMEREQSRADRTGLPLALVVIWQVNGNGGTDNGHGDADLMPGLAQILVERTRCTDLIGSMPGRRLGVLLPHTQAEAAWNVLRDVHTRLAAAYGTEVVARRIYYRVHTTEATPDFEGAKAVPVPAPSTTEPADQPYAGRN